MRRGFDGDPLSAFGSVIGLNRPLDAATAEVLTEPERFVEAIVAPIFDPAAFEILTTRPKWKANVRLLEVGPLVAEPPALAISPHRRRISWCRMATRPTIPRRSGKSSPGPSRATSQLAELRFAWSIARHVKSNAIVLAKDRTVLGVGAGQMSRVDSVEIAVRKAGPRAWARCWPPTLSFPSAIRFPIAATAGVTAVIQPGGSRRDDDVIAACNRFGLPMIFTGRRHFKH